jgi:hypothetical protein
VWSSARAGARQHALRCVTMRLVVRHEARAGAGWHTLRHALELDEVLEEAVEDAQVRERRL